VTRTAGALLAIAALVGVAGCMPRSPDPGGDDDDLPPDAGAPDAPPADAVVPTVDPEVDGRIVINEVMAANALTISDHGRASDWIELYNPNDQELSLQGYLMTDDLAVPGKFTLAAGVVVPAHGYLLLWADDTPSFGPIHLGFRLTKLGGVIGLARPDGSWIDRISYAAQETDFSAEREPDGSDQWMIEWHPTPGSANLAGTGQSMGLEDPSAPPESVPAAGDLSERILGYDVMPEIALQVPPDSVAALLADPRTYVPATLVYDGRTYGPVGLRLKGQNSFEPFDQKPSFRVGVDEYNESAAFFGIKDLTLNNMHGDLSMMHERLAYRIARDAGIPASRCNHALVTVNGQFYGLYANVESVKRRMVKRWFTDDQGTLFEATDVDFVSTYIPRYELEFGDDDRSLLYGLANALTDPSADAAIAAAAGYVDLAEFKRFWAVLSVIAQFDSFPYSIPGDDYFVYADPTSDRLAFMPWGMDETFYSGQVDVTNVYSVLARRCKESAGCFQDYADQTWAVLAQIEQADIEAERTRVAAQIAPYVVLDTRKSYTTDEVLASQAALYWFFADRRTNLQAMLPPPRQ